MGSLIGRIAVVALAAFLAAAVPARGQTTGINGIVQRVDVPSRTIYLTDGRSVTFAPGARLVTRGREVPLTEVRPGWTLMSVRATGSEAVVDLAPPTATASSPPIDATGVVSRVDPVTGTITLADGRVIHMTGRTTFWQPVPIGALLPGALVFVRDAQPLDFRPATSGQAAATAREYRMGTVTAVDRANGRLLLTDGTVVHLLPRSAVDVAGQARAIGDIRPGDEVVIGLELETFAAASPPTISGTTPPPPGGNTDGAVDASEIHVVRRAR